MIKQKLVIVTAFLVALALGVEAYGFADGKKKEPTKFKVRIENISNSGGLTSADGTKYSFAVSPGMFVVTRNKTDFFKVGKKADDGLETQAEDGNPEVLAKKLLTEIGSAYLGIFIPPDGTDFHCFEEFGYENFINNFIYDSFFVKSLRARCATRKAGSDD